MNSIYISVTQNFLSHIRVSSDQYVNKELSIKGYAGLTSYFPQRQKKTCSIDWSYISFHTLLNGDLSCWTCSLVCLTACCGVGEAEQINI